MALNQLDADSRKLRDLESRGPSDCSCPSVSEGATIFIVRMQILLRVM